MVVGDTAVDYHILVVGSLVVVLDKQCCRQSTLFLKAHQQVFDARIPISRALTVSLLSVRNNSQAGDADVRLSNDESRISFVSLVADEMR